MSASPTVPVSAMECLLRMHDEHYELEDYQKGVPRWCTGCGDNAILAAVQRLCRDEGLRPDRTVFVSGIGCSSRLPHYMSTYGFHGLHGRALPVAEGIRLARPDLDVFVSTGDGDCFSIGAAHWIHALRYNMNMTVMVHDNHVYGLTKMQVSPTTPLGLRTNTTPKGAYLEPMQPLPITLGVMNVSFVAQAVDWIPELLYDILRAAYRHRGFSFIRIVQRCPEFLPNLLDPWVKDPQKVLLLHHPNGLQISPALGGIYTRQLEHDPADIHRARQIGSESDPIPVGILYHNPAVPCYEDTRRSPHLRTVERIRSGLDAELDKFTIWPRDEATSRSDPVTPQAQDHVAFYLTGRTAGSGLDGVERLGLVPALMAGYRDLAALRHDFPLILHGAGTDPAVRSLSDLFDDLVRGAAGEPAAARLTHHARQLERAIRGRVAAGATGSLASLWHESAQALVAGADADAALAGDLDRLRTTLADGIVAGCDRALPAHLLKHVWRRAQESRAATIRRTIDRLIVQLSEILGADDEHSAAGMSPERLRGSVGAGFASEFDFGALSAVLTRTRAKVSLSDERRHRIRRLLATLESREFFPAAATGPERDPAFRSVAAALEAYRERLPRMIEVAMAVVLAGLEVEGAYRDGGHDAVFDALGPDDLAKELAAFPDIFVRLDADHLPAADAAALMDVFTQRLPLTILLQTDDAEAFAPTAGAGGHAGTNVRQVASAAIGAGGVFVMQAPCSHLYRARAALARGMDFAGPALFAVYSGAGGASAGVPPYLLAAAAMESRAFPAFVFDPSAGEDWASRFRLEDNPQPEADWPERRFEFEDDTLQRAAEDVAFTVVDFLACHDGHAAHFARVPPESWNGHMVPVHEAVAGEHELQGDRVPYLLMVGPDNTLHRVLVDRRLIRAARRCRDQWHSLQELGGIHNSHAERLLAREKQVWEEQSRREATERPAGPAVAEVATAAAVAPAQPAAPEAPAAVNPNEPRIETARCSTCNECIKINDRMFQYDGNKQARITDLKAGTYAQMVQAAESCQVAVIHPGQPWNPAEPGLTELVERAKAFL